MKVLIPTNFSPYAEFALGLAKHFGSKMPVEWHAINVVKAHDDSMIHDDENVISQACVEETFPELESKKQELANWSSSLPGEVVNFVASGEVVNQISAYIRKYEIDLVIMGTPGAFGAKNLLEGSTAEKIMRVAGVPVLSVKCDRSDLNFSKLILASDFKEIKQDNLDVLKAIQAVYNSEIYLLNVITKKSFQTTRELKKSMNEYAKANGLQNFSCHTYADVSIEEGVAHFADDQQIDLISIGNHGYTGLKFLFKARTSEGIVNHLYKPVLSFKL